MAIIACPACTTANQDRRTICRVCGVSLRQPAPAIGGRITFDVEHPTHLYNTITIPVLISGSPSGIHIFVTRSSIANASVNDLLDVGAIVLGALGGRRRERKV